MKRHTISDDIQINERTIYRQLVVYRDGKRVCSVGIIDRWPDCEITDIKGSYDRDVKAALVKVVDDMGYKKRYYIRERRNGQFTKHEVR